jgi:hypothetical protein
MKRPQPKSRKARNSPCPETDRERALDLALADCSPASDPAAMISPGRREVLHQEDDA